MWRATHMQTHKAIERLVRSEPERERLICGEPVEPDGDEAVNGDCDGGDRRAFDHQEPRLRVTRQEEIMPSRNEHDQHDRGDERPGTESVQYVQRRRERGQRDGYLPRTAPSAREAAR